MFVSPVLINVTPVQTQRCVLLVESLLIIEKSHNCCVLVKLNISMMVLTQFVNHVILLVQHAPLSIPTALHVIWELRKGGNLVKLVLAQLAFTMSILSQSVDLVILHVSTALEICKQTVKLVVLLISVYINLEIILVYAK